MAVGPGNEIWATGAGFVGGASHVWHSLDGGATWSFVDFTGGDVGRQTVGAEGDIVVTDDGTAYVFDTNLYEAWWTVFTPGMPALSIPFVGVDTNAGGVEWTDRPWLTHLGNGLIALTYNNVFATAFRTTADGGLTWSQPTVVSEECNLSVPALSSGGLAFASACLRGSPNGQAIAWQNAPAVFLPEGKSWRTIPIVTPLHDGSGPIDGMPQIVMGFDLDDTAIFVAGGLVEDERLYLSRGTHAGIWTTEWLGPGNRSWFPTVKVRDDGLVGLAYLSHEAGHWGLRAELRSNEGTLLGTTLVDAGPLVPDGETVDRAVGDFISSAWLPDGRFAVAYGSNGGSEPFVEAESRIFFARSEPIEMTF